MTVDSAKQVLLRKRAEQQEKFLEEIRTSMNNKQKPVLVLGAGVSIPIGLPGWQKLVSQLFGYGLVNVGHNKRIYKEWELDTCWKSKEADLIKSLTDGRMQILGGSNVLETGQYIEEMLDGHIGESWVRNETLKEALTMIIHQGMSAEKMKERLRRVSIKNWYKENTLMAVASLLNDSNGFHQAITYNYDTYLEEYLQVIFDKPANEILVHCDGWNTCNMPVANLIEIIHVHGCIPTRYYTAKTNIKPYEPRESKKIILSEDSYYNVEKDEMYNWMNSVQANILNQNPCIFVGFSGDDYNFRRILRQLGYRSKTGNNRPKHYMFIRIDDLYKDIYHTCESSAEKEIKEHAQDYAKVLLDRIFLAKERYWGRFGFYPIWVMEKEIPDKLHSLLP